MICQVDGKDFVVTSDNLIRNRESNGIPLCDATGLSPDGEHSLNFAICRTGTQWPAIITCIEFNYTVSCLTRSSKVATIAIAINAVAGGLITFGVVAYLWRRRRLKSQAKSKDSIATQPSDKYLWHLPPLALQNPQMISTLGAEASSSSGINPKGTHLVDIPVRRGSLHIRSWNRDELKPPLYKGRRSGAT
ncbi:hypothetical protein BJ165DRAFT_28302 [Panaeolus papilionaceus]|nr:hypothetical protein BJ165DRAFT_28302 [Panaeolus papilionaceus]